jgi:hypothetical protein
MIVGRIFSFINKTKLKNQKLEMFQKLIDGKNTIFSRLLLKKFWSEDDING